MKITYITLALSLLLGMIMPNDCYAEEEANLPKQNNASSVEMDANTQPVEFITKKQKPNNKKDTYKVEESSVFGYDFLKNGETDTFPEVSTGILADYILKPRDEISIDIWGELDLHYTLSLDKDMNIIIPEAGRVSLGGLTYLEAKNKILNQLGKTYALFINAANPGIGKAPVDISLAKTAEIVVFVTGAVLKSDKISCKSSESSLFNLIKKAGGVTDYGSLRNIKLRKINGKEISFDVYDFLIKGKLPREVKYLNDGDIVYVPMINRQVTVIGSVKRPGVFELAANDKLADLIELAGGLMPDAIPGLKITRIVRGNAIGKVLDVNFNSQGNFELCDGDIIRAVVDQNNNTTGRDTISISGTVRFLGKYRYANGEKITEFLKRTGGLAKGAFPAGAKLIRNGSPCIINLDKAIESPGSESDFVLCPNDSISIPIFSNFVTIQGAIESPTSILHQKGKDAYYYIENAGGYKNNADKGDVKIIKPNGSIVDASSGSWFTSNPEVPAGSTINVQEK